MSYPSGRTGSAPIASSIKNKKATVESCQGGCFQSTLEKTKAISKTKSLESGPKSILPKPPLAVFKSPLSAGESKLEKEVDYYHSSNLKLLNSKMKILAAVTKAQMQEVGDQNTFKRNKKDTDSESNSGSSSSANSKKTIAVPLVLGPPKSLNKKPNLRTPMTSLAEKALEPDAQGPVDDPSPPPRKTLPNIFVLGTAPPKPKRPLRVHLEKFTKVIGQRREKPQQKWTGPAPPNVLSSLPKIPPVPSLTVSFPHQAPAMRANAKEEDSYHNVGVLDLPRNLPSAECPRMKPQNGDLDEMYENTETVSLQLRKSKGKQEEMDPKRQKNRGKKEKDFRKQFKFEGKIQVLYQVSVVPMLTCKKWGNKDLPLQPGEIIDVIVKPVNDKLIGRNQDGKFGYIATSNIVPMNEIYDDVIQGYIYDND